jgi:hypothetical protein
MESDAKLRTIRRCRASLADLADGMSALPQEWKAYLDLETGEVQTISEYGFGELEEIHESMPEEIWKETSAEIDAAFKAALDEYETQNTEPEELEIAHAIEQDLAGRYVQLPEADTGEDYRDMEAFIFMVSSPRLVDRLERAIRGRGAFRRFKDELHNADSDVDELERWYAFKQERLGERIRSWLKAERIELIESGG